MMQIGGGHLIIHRGKASTTAVDRVVKLAHGRLSKIVPEAVRLRLETPQEVLLLEAEVWEERMCDPPLHISNVNQERPGLLKNALRVCEMCFLRAPACHRKVTASFFLIAEPANICGVDQALPQRRARVQPGPVSRRPDIPRPSGGDAQANGVEPRVPKSISILQPPSRARGACTQRMRFDMFCRRCSSWPCLLRLHSMASTWFVL
jgi:hypothetical protein